MENSSRVVLHPQHLEILFAFKSKLSYIFRDVLGIHEIHHIAVTRINEDNELISLSSTPSMEFNLFSSSLWHFDKTYDPKWFQLGSQALWQNLYDPERYDELYYLKQIKHSFPIGLSIAAKIDNDYVIYSLASRKSCQHTQELFTNQRDDFYKIGQYCSNMLNPLFNYCDTLSAQNLQLQV
ncbi:hypothetical protein [Legionella worsleiensis]|uniref:Putative FlgJ-like protein n=1 Tax=Legionella worsleiensis TaxID=45076 RepID=A0A0W1AFL6_9GAMM|nr:hypothetical protein [Legionella worsleiensis]KTD79968.1 putative FlgJ-like protein [Legionella worsleiensis]STY32439.1 putative FlgJ-like protein [Legionella worsleiensis]